MDVSVLGRFTIWIGFCVPSWLVAILAMLVYLVLEVLLGRDDPPVNMAVAMSLYSPIRLSLARIHPAGDLPLV